MSVTPGLQWVCFDIGSRVHDCPSKSLGPDLKQLIEKAIARMSPNNNILTNTDAVEIVDQTDIVIENLKNICRCLISIRS